MNKYVSIDMLKKMTWEISCEDKFRFIAVSVADIDSAPSIDIVRCSECKHWNDADEYCEWFAKTHTSADDFCSYGERDE